MATFSDAEQRKLDALKEKKRKALQDARNEKRRNDRTCQSLFGMTADEVKAKLADPDPRPQTDYWNEYYELKQLVTRLMMVTGHTFEDFEQYVEIREQKAAAKANSGQ